MNRVLAAVGIISLAFVAPAVAAEVTVKVSDQDQQAFGNLPGAVDQCVAGLQLRGDAQVCKLIAAFVTEFGAKVKAAASPPVKE
jgi:hypothetical protein